jgi:hypothetical protein
MQFIGRGNKSNDERRYSIDSIAVNQPSCSITVGGMNEVVARFNDGDTDTAPDGFTGMAGAGWNSAWSTRGDRATLNATVETDDELHAGYGNCLKMTVDNMDPVSYAIGGVTREYTRVNEDGIDWTKDHTIQFSVRIDENLSFFSQFEELNDKYQIFDQPYARGGTNAETSWGAYFDGTDLRWTFVDGSDNVASNIEADTGEVYDFTIAIHPDEHSYDVTLINGDDTFAVDDLSWRNDSDTVGGFLNFMARGESTSDVRAWSIDEIVITQAAEDVPGDANGDGWVDEDDASVLAANWGKTGVSGPGDGDFTGDGAVNVADAAVLAANWRPNPGSESTATVPEPGSLILLILGVLMLAVRRRRVR